MNPITRIRSLRASASVLVAVVLLSALATTASARPERRSDSQLTVYAASSLTTAFPLFDVAQKYNFAGSDALAHVADPDDEDRAQCDSRSSTTTGICRVVFVWYSS